MNSNIESARQGARFEWQKWLNRVKTPTPRHYLGRLMSNGLLHPVCRESGLLGTEVINHLRHHGIEAALHRTESRNGDVATALISEAKRRKADLIIMGGYGHSRLREQLLGDATDNLLHQSPVPVLMAH
jgi:nucleotide-binding universal stress UspA family protein